MAHNSHNSPHRPTGDSLDHGAPVSFSQAPGHFVTPFSPPMQPLLQPAYAYYPHGYPAPPLGQPPPPFHFGFDIHRDFTMQAQGALGRDPHPAMLAPAAHSSALPAPQLGMQVPVPAAAPVAQAAVAWPNNRPNNQIVPGVFEFNVIIHRDQSVKEVVMNTNTGWDHLTQTVCEYIGKRTADELRIGYRVIGGGRKPSLLERAGDWELAKSTVRDLALRARTKAVAIDILDMRPSPPAEAKTKKRTRADDVPPSVDSTLNQALRELKAALFCETHDGHCYVTPSGTHRRCDYREISLWAKQNTIGEADIHNPPHCLNFERSNKKPRGRRHSPTVNVPDVHVHISASEMPTAATGASTSSTTATTFDTWRNPASRDVDLSSPSHFVMQSLSSSSTAAASSSVAAAAGPQSTGSLLSPVPRYVETFAGAEYPTVDTLLQFIHSKYPQDGFLDLKGALAFVCFEHVDDITIVSEAALHSFTQIDPHKIVTIFFYAEQLLRDTNNQVAESFGFWSTSDAVLDKGKGRAHSTCNTGYDANSVTVKMETLEIDDDDDESLTLILLC